MLERIFGETIGIKEEEEVLIVSDYNSFEMGEIVRKTVEKLSREVISIIMKQRERDGEEPPGVIAESMRAADVVIAPTSKSLTHTEARKRACRAGARVATMPGITKSMLFSGAMTADYREVRRISDFIARKLTEADEIRIKTEAGTDFKASLKDRKGIADSGDIKKAGTFGNLPAGEAFIAPLEDSDEGRIVFDASMANLGRIAQPVIVEVSNGRAFNVNRPELEELFRSVENSRVIAEIGIGCNPSARITGNVLEDEKAFKTVHIAFGDNNTFGGTNRANLHMDGVMLKPSLWLDGKKIMEEGNFLCFR
ncbi:MAG TPA: aminopeptidase [Euryarchaeota archaeon]|nr:2,5-dihydroxypyridine 5,6-dioxygenase [archaeon BMS3Bbin15]HDL14637.1 aminopeptidase [Euryarchaeota archaeon]